MKNPFEKVYLDSSLFKALVDQDDDFHPQAQKIWHSLLSGEFKLITSNYILDETYTLIRTKCGLDKVRKLRIILSEYADKVSLMRVTVQDEAQAWTWFWNDWKHLSYTDCVSFALMKRLNLKRVATFDQHFSRAGFQIV